MTALQQTGAESRLSALIGRHLSVQSLLPSPFLTTDLQFQPRLNSTSSLRTLKSLQDWGVSLLYLLPQTMRLSTPFPEQLFLVLFASAQTKFSPALRLPIYETTKVVWLPIA